jgi:hypothetical protein
MVSNIVEFDSLVARELCLRMIKSKKTKSDLDEWMNNRQVVQVYKPIRGSKNLLSNIGVITSVEPGVWGYGGDRWAVVVEGEHYPASYCNPVK